MAYGYVLYHTSIPVTYKSPIPLPSTAVQGGGTGGPRSPRSTCPRLPPIYLRALSNREVRNLGSDHQPSNGRRRQRRKDTRDQRRECQSRDITTALGRELTEDTDLDTERANVAKAAYGVCGNELRAGGEVGVVRVGGEGREGIVFVLFISSVLAMHLEFEGPGDQSLGCAILPLRMCPTL